MCAAMNRHFISVIAGGFGTTSGAAPAAGAEPAGEVVSISSAAVSYTHLDVYKRQVDIIITTALIPGKPAPRLITAEMVQSMKPVSYTHLDVYKRQA